MAERQNGERLGPCINSVPKGYTGRRCRYIYRLPPVETWGCGLPAWDDAPETKAGDPRCEFHSTENPKDIKQRLEAAVRARAELQEAELSSADLEGADLEGARLKHANLSHAHLSRANLRKADLSDANLAHAWLSGADISGATLQFARLPKADLSSANLSGSLLWGADLSGACLLGADLSHANLLSANLSKARVSGANLSRAELEHANLSEAELPEANLTEAALYGANLTWADLQFASLTKACLSHALLWSACLFSADLSGADLSYAELRGVWLLPPTTDSQDTTRASVIYPDLRKADLRGARLGGAKIDSETELAGVKFGPQISGPERCILFDEVLAEKDDKWEAWQKEKAELGLFGGSSARPTFAQCAQAYRQLKLCCQQCGDYRKAGEWHFREMCCLRRQMARDGGPVLAPIVEPLRRIFSRPVGCAAKESDAPVEPVEQCESDELDEEEAEDGDETEKGPPRLIERAVLWLVEYVAGYGERPSWVAGWAVLVLLFFAVLQSIVGVVAPSAALGQAAGASASLVVSHNFWTCLYFSFVTFTTLGYGDVLPSEGVGRALAAMEAVLGFVFMLLFTVCVVRKYSR